MATDSESESEARATTQFEVKRRDKAADSAAQAQALARPFQATDADFTLISSDGVAFKVHKYHLLASSTVIRELLSLGSGDSTTTLEQSLTLVDPTTESAGSTSIFLSLLYGIDLTKPQHRFVIPCIGFLRKYDCQPAMNSLRTLIRAQLVATEHTGMNPYRIFQAASQLDDHITCSEAIKRGGEQCWNKKTLGQSDRGVHQFLPNRSIFDPATMGMHDMEIIPPAYFLALVRAVDAAKMGNKGTTDWVVAAQEFKRILELHRTAFTSTQASVIEPMSTVPNSDMMGKVVVLETSDGQTFTVDKDVLSSASDVFAEVLDESDASTIIHLSESAAHLQVMIDLLTKPIPPPPSASTLWRIATIIPILQKYELDQLLLSLKSTLRKAAIDPITPKIFVFLAAARLRSMDICSTCIRNGGVQTWRDALLGLEDEVEEEIGIERDMRELSCFDVKGWSEGVSVKAPGEVMSRLWKAQMGVEVDCDDPGEVEKAWNEISRRFEEECG